MGKSLLAGTQQLGSDGGTGRLPPPGPRLSSAYALDKDADSNESEINRFRNDFGRTINLPLPEWTAALLASHTRPNKRTSRSCEWMTPMTPVSVTWCTKW